MSGRPHRHEFHGLWCHFGEYHKQKDRHYHPCTVEDCPAMLVGVERNCGGPTTRHHVCKWANDDVDLIVRNGGPS